MEPPYYSKKRGNNISEKENRKFGILTTAVSRTSHRNGTYSGHTPSDPVTPLHTSMSLVAATCLTQQNPETCLNVACSSGAQRSLGGEKPNTP